MTLQDYRKRKFWTIKAFAEAYGCGATKASGILNGKYHLTLSKSEVKHLASVLGIGFVECADACDETYAELQKFRKGDAWKRTARTYKGIWARWAWEEGILRDTRKAADMNDWTEYRKKYMSDYNREKPKYAPPRMPADCFAILGISPTSSSALIITAFRNKVKAASDGHGGYVGDMHRLVLAKEEALVYAVRSKAGGCNHDLLPIPATLAYSAPIGLLVLWQTHHTRLRHRPLLWLHVSQMRRVQAVYETLCGPQGRRAEVSTGWQRQFKASVRSNRAIGMQQSLKTAIANGTISQDSNIKELARCYEMSQAQVKRILAKGEKK